MLVSRESYTTKVNLKPLNEKKYSQKLINSAYALYVKDFNAQGFKGSRYTIHGFKRYAYNRDLFLQIAIQKQRDRKINRILNGTR